MILALDVSHRIGLMSLELEDGRLLFRHSDKPREHLDFVQKSLAHLEEDSGLSWTDLRYAALTLGPGSFTGLRVGLAVIKGLLYGTRIPLLPLSSLSVPAAAAGDGASRAVIRKARGGEYWTAFFEPGGSRALDESLRVESEVLRWLERIRSERPGLRVLCDDAQDLGLKGCIPEAGPRQQLKALAQLAHSGEGLVRGRELDALLPRYLVEPSVTPPREHS